MNQPDESIGVKHSSLPVVLMLAGVLLMVFGPLIVGLAPAGSLSLWSDADQAALQAASGEFHAMNSALANGPQGNRMSKGGESFDPVAVKARQQAAKAELQRQQDRLQAAQSRPTWVLWTLRLVGVALAALGVWGYFRAGAAPAQTGPPAKSPTTPGNRTATLPPKLEALKRRLGR